MGQGDIHWRWIFKLNFSFLKSKAKSIACNKRDQFLMNVEHGITQD